MLNQETIVGLIYHDYNMLRIQTVLYLLHKLYEACHYNQNYMIIHNFAA